MIFEKEIMEMTQPKFEFPTEMSILKEYYENEITLLNYVIEYKNALSNVNESTELAVIQEEFNNKAINKIKEIIKKFIEFCKNILRTVKDKIKEHTTSINHKLQTIDYYIKYKKLDNIIIKYVKGDYVNDFDREAKECGKKLEQSISAIQNAIGREDVKDYDIKDAYDIIKELKVEAPDPNKYIDTAVIKKENAAGLVSSIKKDIQIAKYMEATFASNISNLVSVAEKAKNIANPNTSKNQEILSCINMIITKSQMLANTHASVINGFLVMTNKELDTIIKKAKVKEEE